LSKKSNKNQKTNKTHQVGVFLKTRVFLTLAETLLPWTPETDG